MRFLSFRHFSCFLLICLFLSSLATYAQTGTTSIRGTVTDTTGAIISGASVKLASPALALERTATTSQTGQYEFVALPPGSYDLSCESKGFRRFEQKGLRLLVNNPATVDVVMQIGAATEIVEVSAQAQTLNTTDASIGVAFGENQVKQLPLEGRNVPDLLSLQPGVAYTGNRADTSTSDTRSGAVNGARSDQGNVILDGIRVNDEGSHAFTAVLPVTLDSVQEFRVTTTNADADQGGTSGAQVALVTKSGTNEFHGSAYEYHRNTYTSANDYFNKIAQLAGCALPNPNDCNKAPTLIRNIFGASVGGPILKDRLFLFLNYEGTRRSEQIVSSGEEVPSAAMRDGVLQYLCALNPDGSLNTTACPGGPGVQGVSGQTYTPQPGYQALSPAQLQKIDPAHIGVSLVALKYFQSLPLPNSSISGDGFNYQGFVFAAPTHDTQNVYIAKADYNITRDGKHRVSVSGALRNDGGDACAGCQPYFPGDPPQLHTVIYNKGIIAGYSGVLRPSLISSFHYGFVRESVGTIGNSNQPWVIFNFGQSITRTSSFQRPTHNFSEDLSWLHGKHTWQFGGYISYMRNPRLSFDSSFDTANTNSVVSTTSGFAGTSSPLNPANNPNGAGPCDPNTGIGCFPGVDQSFNTHYDFPLTDILGMPTSANTVFNYGRSLNLLPQGAPITRRYAADTFEPYVQDIWKIKPTLTLTLGLRYSLFSPVWETKGLQVCPSPSLGQWFANRQVEGANGIPSNQDAPLSVNWCGPANGKSGYWNWDYGNLGPKVAFAWAPNRTQGLLGKFLGNGKTSIRGGFGIVYDRFGQGVIDEFNGNSFGLTTSIGNAILPLNALPRITSVNVIPASLLQPNPGAPSFPQIIAPGPTARGTSLDTSLKTPYSYTIDFSIARELPSGFSLEVAYVGRLSHRLLSSEDVATPLNLNDKKSGLDYFSAVQPFAKLYEQQGVNDGTFKDSMVSPAVQQYWRDMIQPLVSGGAYQLGAYNTTTCLGNIASAATTDPVLAAFDIFCEHKTVETTSLQALDVPNSGFGNAGIPDATNDPNCDMPGHPACRQYYIVGGPNAFFTPQYASLSTLRTIGFSNYNAMQVTVRHQMNHGFQFDFNYTYSKSIDICSDAERTGNNGALNFNGGCQIFNAWQPYLFRSVSDFDATHQFNSNWIVDLPFGRGRAIASHVNRGVDAAIGGWQLSGLFRLTSGFPYTIYDNASAFPTDWWWEGAAEPTTSQLSTGAFKNPNGTVNIFRDPATAQSSFLTALPGQVGVRNPLRGDGYFGVDLGLSKRWTMPWSEKQGLSLRWEVFNVTNSTRFDFNDQSSASPSESNNSIGVGQTFGNYTHLMTNPRVMQFALRYEF